MTDPNKGWPQWHDNTLNAIRRIFIFMGIMAILLLVLGVYQLVIGADASHVANVACEQVHYLLHNVEQARAQQIQSTHTVLPHLHLGGLSPKQLTALVHAKEISEATQLGELKEIARHAC